MALPKLSKTNYVGIYYYKHKIKGKIYVGRFEVNKKKYKRILGYENDEFKTNEKIAFIKKEQLKESIKSGKILRKKEIKFNELWEMYLDHIKSSQAYTSKTIITKTSTYNKHMKNEFGNKNINDIDINSIQNFANKLLKTNKPKTVDNYTSDLSSIFKFAIKRNLYDKENPVKNIELPKYDNERVFPLNEDEVKKLFNTIINFHEPLWRGVYTFLLQGRRKDEVLSITWEDIDLKQKIYTIKYQENKAKKNMTFEMTDELYEILVNIKDKKGLVFKSPVTGKKIKNIRYAWDRILKAANIDKHITTHELRHLLGYTLLNDTSATLEQTAAVLGQTTTKATKRYAKVRQKVAANGLKRAFDYLKD
jgi:integrase